MTSITNSEAHFSNRCIEIGFSDRGLQAVLAAGYTTLGKLAFGVGQPGVPLDEAQFQAFANNVLGAMVLAADVVALKRMVFESHTMVMSELREMVSNPDANASKRVPAVERESKMTALRRRLVGIFDREAAGAKLCITRHGFSTMGIKAVKIPIS